MHITINKNNTQVLKKIYVLKHIYIIHTTHVYE